MIVLKDEWIRDIVIYGPCVMATIATPKSYVVQINARWMVFCQAGITAFPVAGVVLRPPGYCFRSDCKTLVKNLGGGG